MALFKIFNNIDIQDGKTTRNSLPNTSTKGYCYFDANTNLFYIDIKDSNGILSDIYDEEYRIALNGYKALYDSNGESISNNINTIKNSYSTKVYFNTLLQQYLAAQGEGELNISIQPITLLSSSWSDNTQYVYLNKINNDSLIIDAPTSSSFNDFVNNRLVCAQHQDNVLQFYCETEPNIDININIIIVENLKDEIKFIEDCTFSNINSKTYTGSKITQSPLVKDGTTTLINNVDYIISYSNNVNVGTGQCIITGIDKYNGIKVIDFNITLDINRCTISTVSDQGYKNQEIKPKIDLYINRQKLVENIDYTLSYENNFSIGEATINITGINACSGTKSINFNITVPDVLLSNFTLPTGAVSLEYHGREVEDYADLDYFTLPYYANSLTVIERDE